MPVQARTRLGGPWPCRWPLDEGGVQRPRVLLAEGSGLKQLLDEGRLLLLQLCDPFALVGHLLAWGGQSRHARPPATPSPPAPHLREQPVLLLQHQDGLLLPAGSGGRGGGLGGAWGPRGGGGRSLWEGRVRRDWHLQLSLQDRARGGQGTHRTGTGCSQQLPQAPGHLLHLGQQSPQWAGAPLSRKVLGGSGEGVLESRAIPGKATMPRGGPHRWLS